MAVRIRPDNLSLVDPAVQAEVDATRFDFEELWEHRESLRAICLRMADDPSTADDLVQETFVRALAHAESLDKRASFGPWLATVARRRSVDEIRFRRRLRPMSAPPEVETGAAEDPAEQVLKQEMVQRLRSALGELSTRERQLLLRQVTHGLTLAELAEEEDTSIASVRSVLNRARTKLRSSLERGGPLGAAPLPRLVAAVKRRLQGVAARLEGHASLLGSAGAQLGEVVAAVIAAVALLAGGTAAPEARTTFLSPVPAVAPTQGGAISESTTTTAVSRHAPPPPAAASDPATAVDSEPVPGQPLTTLPDAVDMPPVSDGVEQPDDAVIEHWAVADDGRTVLAWGLTTGDGGNWQASGEPALFRSDDAGRSWRRLPGGRFAGGRILLPPTFPRVPTFFVDNGTTLLRTDDGGGLFMPVATTRNASGISPRYRDGDRRILVGPAGLAAYHTVDGTIEPFTAVPQSASFGSLAFPPQFEQDGTVLLGGGVTHPDRFEGYVQACTPTACAAPVEVPGMRDEPRLLVSSSAPGVILAWSFTGLARSVDGGKSFIPVDLPGDNDLKAVIDGAPGELLAARGGQGDHASGLFRSRDGGRTWTQFALGTALQRGAWSIAYLPSGRILAKPSDAPGIRCSADGGVTWAPRCP